MKAIVDILNRQRKVAFGPDLRRRVKEAAREALAAGGWQGPAEVSVCLVDDAGIAELNRRYRGEDGPTDVLAFPQDAATPGGDGLAHLGDVVISLERAQAQNADLGAELELLVIHGILHLLGHDHADATDAERMRECERKAMRRLSGTHDDAD